MEIVQGIDVFLESFAYLRSFTYPAEVVYSDSLGIVRDVNRTGAKARNEEIAYCGDSPEEAHQFLLNYDPKSRYFLLVMHSPEKDMNEVRDSYKALGYRLTSTEWLMVRNLENLPDYESPYKTHRVRTPEQAELMKIADGKQQIRSEDLTAEKPIIRMYYAENEGTPISWVKSIQKNTASCYVSSVYTQPDFRRRGIATALMYEMLKEDKEAGAKWSILLASSQGSKLYPKLGYETLGIMRIFKKSKK